MIRIFHHNDTDGRCAAAIALQYCARVLPIKLYEVNYKDTIPVDEIQPGDTIIIVDFSFKPEVMEQVRLKTKWIIWCDHHVTAKDYPYQELDGYRDFSDKGLSGCECTWKCFYPEKPIPQAVRLIGDYDAWRLETDPLCFQFYEGIKLYDTNPESTLWQDLLVDNRISEIIDAGKFAIRYRNNYCESMAKPYGYETELDGHNAYAMNLCGFGSKQFGSLFNLYPLCIAYIYDGIQFTVSLYSEKIDVGEIAKKYGGGGHRGAAGFQCKELPFARRNYE